MEWIENKNLDKKNWDTLVTHNNAFIFDYSWYLDAVTDNWGVLFIDDNKSKGIAVSFTEKLGQKIVAPSYFHRASSWIGNWSNQEKQEALKFISSLFKGGNLAFEDTEINQENYYYQIIQPSTNYEEAYHTQAKRMLSKAHKSVITLDNQFDKSFFLKLVIQELGKKVEMWNTAAVDKFSSLIDALIQNNSFHFIEIKHNNKTAGGLIIMQLDNRHIYLKGVCIPEVKKLGGMYAAMDRAISYAMEKNAIFDFGGSRVEGVARFNNNLGGINQFYAYKSWNEYPFWFKTLKKIRNTWKKQVK